MKRLFYLFIFLFLIHTLGTAQLIKTELQVAGLTCSSCSRATDKQLRSLDFIDSIGVDLTNATFTLYFKNDKTIDFDQIKKKVQDAGFSIAGLKFTYKFDNLKIDSNSYFKYQNMVFYFVSSSPQTLNGDITLKIIDKGFVSKKEYKEYLHKVAEQAASPGYRAYHITL